MFDRIRGRNKHKNFLNKKTERNYKKSKSFFIVHYCAQKRKIVQVQRSSAR